MSDDNPTTLTAIEAAEKIAAGEMSAEEYVGACLERISSIDEKVRAFAHLDPSNALTQARALDERRRNGQSIGPLHGIPVAVMDTFDTADYPTECGTPLLKGHRPMRDSAAVARLRVAGAVVIGKTVTGELGYSYASPARNPHDLERTPGGASSGSAAAVAAAMVPLAIGFQTDGSVILPASYCGVYGVKPTHGLISRTGALPLSRALDHVGTFARSLTDSALLLEALAGYDADDPDTRAVAAPAFLENVAAEPPMPPQFAFMRTPVWDKADADTRAAFEKLVKDLGAAATPIELPVQVVQAWDDHRAIMAADMAHNLREAVARGGEALSKPLRNFLSEGGKVNAVRYLAARDAARRYAAGLTEVFTEYDAILTPAATGIAPKGDAAGDPAFCTLWSLTGLPAVTLPLLSGGGGMPLGVQLVGPAGDDARLLRTANWLINQMTK